MTFQIIAQEIDDRFFPALSDMGANITREFPSVKAQVSSGDGGDLAVYQSHFLILNCSLPHPGRGNFQVTLVVALRQSTVMSPVTVDANVGWATYDFDETELALFPGRTEANEMSIGALDEGLPKLHEILRATIRKCMGFAREQGLSSSGPFDIQKSD